MSYLPIYFTETKFCFKVVHLKVLSGLLPNSKHMIIQHCKQGYTEQKSRMNGVSQLSDSRAGMKKKTSRKCSDPLNAITLTL